MVVAVISMSFLLVLYDIANGFASGVDHQTLGLLSGCGNRKKQMVM